MRSQLIEAPALEPVTLAEAKAFTKVSHGLEDTLFKTWIASARTSAEALSRLSIAPQKWRFSYALPRLTGFGFGTQPTLQDPDDIAEKAVLKKSPIVSVDDVQLVARDGSKTALTGWTLVGKALYWADNSVLLDGQWVGLEIDATCGFPIVGADPNADPPVPGKVDCPEDLREAILIMVADRYENRGTTGVTPDLAKEILLTARSRF